MRIIETDSHFKHQQEWLNSCVDEEIIALNARSLHGTTPYEYLLDISENYQSFAVTSL